MPFGDILLAIKAVVGLKGRGEQGALMRARPYRGETYRGESGQESGVTGYRACREPAPEGRRRCTAPPISTLRIGEKTGRKSGDAGRFCGKSQRRSRAWLKSGPPRDRVDAVLLP